MFNAKQTTPPWFSHAIYLIDTLSSSNIQQRTTFNAETAHEHSAKARRTKEDREEEEEEEIGVAFSVSGYHLCKQ